MKFPGCIPVCEKDYFYFCTALSFRGPSRDQGPVAADTEQAHGRSELWKRDRREWEGRQRHKEVICSRSQNTSLRGQDLLVLHEVKELKIPNTR